MKTLPSVSPTAPQRVPAMSAEPLYALEPTAFRSMQEAEETTNTLEDHINDRNVGAANIRPVLVINAAEHDMSQVGATPM